MKRISAGLLPILALLASFGPFATDMYLAAFPDMAVSLHTDDVGVAGTLSVFLLGMALGQIIYGPVSDRYGRRRPLLAGIALYISATVCCLASRDAASFIAFRFVQALGGCCGIILGRAMVRDLFAPQETARIFSNLAAISMVAPLVAPSAGVALILIGGWRMIFVFLLLLGIACFISVWLWLPESLPEERRAATLRARSVLVAFAELLGRRPFLPAAMTAAAAAGILFAFITGSSQVFISHFGLSKPAYAVVFTVVVLAFIGGGQVNRLVLRTAAPATILRGAAVANLAAGLVLLWGAFGGLLEFLLPLVVAMTTLGFILPNATALAMGAARRHVGSASSLLGFIQFGAGFTSGSIVAVTQAHSPAAMAIAIAGCGAIGAVCGTIATRRSPFIS